MFCCLWLVGTLTTLALGKKEDNHQKQRKNNEGFFHLRNISVYKSWKVNRMMVHFEPMTRIELVTPSLPRKYSTPELHRQYQSGRRDSNPRPSAWKANALSTELLPQCYLIKKCRQSDDQRSAPLGGESRIRTYEGVRQQIYSLPQLATLVFPQDISKQRTYEPNVRFELTTPRLQITCSGQLS